MPHKKLLIIGATWEQVPLIRRAKQLGCEVVVTAPNSGAEGFAIADHAEIVDPRSLDKLAQIVADYEIDAVTADECDYSNYAAAFLRNLMGWPNHGMAAVQHTTNKRWMRERCRDHHVIQPRFVACRTFEEVCAAAGLIGFPVIIKPVDNRGSFGVRRVDGSRDLESAFLHALMHSHSREILIEAFIEGTHLTVDGCVDAQGRHINLGFASKKILPGEKPIITEVLYPAEIEGDTAERVLNTNSKVIEALGITRGITHSEYILDSRGRCFLLETANRGGGVLTSNVIIPAICGVDISEVLIREALGKSFSVEPWEETKAAMLGFLVFAPGTVVSIRGVKEAERLEGVLHIRLLIKEGDQLNVPQSGAERHGFGIVCAATPEAARELFVKIKETIHVTYDD